MAGALGEAQVRLLAQIIDALGREPLNWLRQPVIGAFPAWGFSIPLTWRAE
jgi:hypothetical protein